MLKGCFVDSFTLAKIEFDSLRRILAGYCRCNLGKDLAVRIGPSRNPSIINRWLEQTSQMVTAVRDIGLPPFGGVTDISQQLSRAKPGAGADGEDFAAIASALEGAANVQQYLYSAGENLSELAELAGNIGSFEKEINAIRDIIASDGTVRDDASEKLASLRRQIDKTSQDIHDVIHSYLRQPDVAKLLQDVTVTLHGDRYVLPVKIDNRGRLPGVVHRLSQSGQTAFVEPNASVELNNQLADLHEDERREIERLLSDLAVKIFARSGEISATMRILAQVDLISAKAQYAYQFDMTCPEIVERGSLQFSKARHPLLIDQELQDTQAGRETHPVVPIDVRLGSDFDLLVITGSNTGGKTVTLKTVALLAVMAQSGMHIPVQRGAKMPIFRDIFIDIGDEQSLQQSLSTFGAHIKRVKYVLRKADRNCLVLIDELGAGTDPDEGGAIGQAILDELRSIGCLGMVTTHLSVLKAYAFNHDRVDNASVEFNTKTLRPTYHLQIGTPGESHAITVAGKLGLPRKLTSNAKRHLSAQGKQFSRAIRATSVARQTAEVAREDAQAAQLAALTQQENFEAKLADLHRLKGEFETWLASLGELKSGEEMYVPSLETTAKLVRLEFHKQIALFDTGKVQVEVPLRELMPDLGQVEVRQEIASLKKQVLQQASQTESAMEEAKRIKEEYHRSLEQQKQRGRQFDAWLGAIARVKIGDEVPISKKPGTGKVVELNLPGLKAAVETTQGKLELSLQELFPQSGPFAHKNQTANKKHGKPKEKRTKTRPITRRSKDSKAAKASREELLKTQPGQQVFLVPFNKPATLIRVNESKDQAVVQSGIFEMEIPLADLEPIHK